MATSSRPIWEGPSSPGRQKCTCIHTHSHRTIQSHSHTHTHTHKQKNTHKYTSTHIETHTVPLHNYWHTWRISLVSHWNSEKNATSKSSKLILIIVPQLLAPLYFILCTNSLCQYNILLGLAIQSRAFETAGSWWVVSRRSVVTGSHSGLWLFKTSHLTGTEKNYMYDRLIPS